MKKVINIFLAVLITLFSFPINSLNVNAEGKVYDDIKDGTYEITAKLLKEGTQEESAAAQFMSDKVTLDVNDGEFALTFYIPHNDMMSFNMFEVEGDRLNEPSHTDDEFMLYTFELSELKEKLLSKVTYEVPAINMVHENVKMDIELVGLDKLPKIEKEPGDNEKPGDGNDSDEGETEKPEEPEKPSDDHRVVSDLVTEAEADVVYEINYDTESSSTARFIGNPVKVLVKDNKKYIQLPITNGGEQYFRSLTFDGKEVIWSSVTEPAPTIQHEVSGNLADIKLDVAMVIQAGPNAMPHDGIKITFDASTLKISDNRVEGELLSEKDADLVYEIEFETESSSTARFLGSPVKVLLKDNKKYVQAPVTNGGEAFFRSLTLNGKEATWSSVTEAAPTIQYEVEGQLKEDIDVTMVIDIGRGEPMYHGGVTLAHDLATINLEDKRILGEIIAEEDADSVQKYELKTDSSATERQLGKYATVVEKDGKQYLQIEVSGAEHFRSFAFNDKEVVWNDAKDKVQYELDSDKIPTNKKEAIDVSMVISPSGWEPMYHGDINLWLGDKVNLITLGEKTEVNEGEKIVLEGNSYLFTPENLADGVEVTITNQTDAVSTFGSFDGLEIAGEIYSFNFENLTEITEPFTLVFDYNADEFDKEEVDIYYFNETEWIAQGGKVENGQITLEVDHFSVYGVFAKVDVPVEVPSEKEEIDYVILHENKKDESIANSFFTKPGLLFEADGKQYVEVTINNGNMVKNLETEYGKAVTVKENADGSIVVQFIINDNLSDTKLDMFIDVPGLYAADHTTYFSILKDDSGKGSGGQGGTPSKGTTDDKKPKKEKTDKVKADKASTINYVVYQADKDEVSAADSFFKKPAILLEKDGETYLQFTITSWSMVNWLKANGKDVLVIAEDKGKDTATVQIKIDGDLSEYITLGMKITVPGLYEMEHDARLALYPSSIVELEGEEAEGYFIHTGVAKPGDFGTNGDDKKGKGGKTNNPQTGDTSQIFFFTMLLIGSLGVLAIQLRRRLA